MIKKEKTVKSESTAITSEASIASVQSELEHLCALLDDLKAIGANSISDLEVKIARLQK